MSVSILLLWVGSLVQFFFGSLWYVLNTLRGKSKPNRMTFLVWAAGPFIGVAAGISIGGGWALLPVFVAGFGPLLIFFASFFNSNAYWKLGMLDYVCGMLAVCAFSALFFVHQPIAAIALAITADALAALPTLIKSWRYPETETAFAYVVAFANAGIGLAVVGVYSFAAAGFLYYLFLVNFLLVVALYRKRFLALFETRA